MFEWRSMGYLILNSNLINKMGDVRNSSIEQSSVILSQTKDCKKKLKDYLSNTC